MSLSSARSITQSVGAPRAVYLDYPLGQTAGRAGDLAEQCAVLEAACGAFETLVEPGSVLDLPMRWAADDDWKERVMRPEPASQDAQDAKDSKGPQSPDPLAGDQRTPRRDTPQYQSPLDEQAADPNCPSCIFLAE